MIEGRLLGMIEGIEGTEEWMIGKGDEGRVGLLLGVSVTGVKENVLVRIDRVVWEMCSTGGRGGNI